MKIRKSFFIRWLLSVDKQHREHSVIDIEHVQSGNKHRVSTLEEANEWMKQISDASLEEQNFLSLVETPADSL